MSSRKRSASVGAAPFNKPIARTPAESSVTTQPEVRCACQYFQCDSLLPERINPVGSRPTSRAGDRLSTSRDKGLDQHPHLYQSSSTTEQRLDAGHHIDTCPHANTLPNPVQKPVFTAGNRTQVNTLPKATHSTFGSQRSMDQLRMSQSSLLKRYRPQSEAASVAPSTTPDENPHFEHYTMSRSSSKARSIHGSRRSIDRFSTRHKFERTASDQTDPELEDLDWEMSHVVNDDKQAELKRAAEAVTSAITQITQSSIGLEPAPEKPAPKPLTLSLSGDTSGTGNRRIISGTSMPVTTTVQVTLPPTATTAENKENLMSIPKPVVPKPLEPVVAPKQDFFPTMTPANQTRKTNVPAPVEPPPVVIQKADTTNVNPSKPSHTSDMPHITEGMRDAIFAAQILTPKSGDKVQEEFKLTEGVDRMDHYHTLPSKKRMLSTRTPSVDAVRKGTGSQQFTGDRIRTSQPNLQAFSRPPLPKQRSEEERSVPFVTTPDVPVTTNDPALDNRSRPTIRNNRHVERSKSSSLLQKYTPKKMEHAYDRPQSEIRDVPSKIEDKIEDILKRRESSTTIIKSEPLDEKKVKQSSLLRKYYKDRGDSKDSGDGTVTIDVTNRFSPVMFGGKKRNVVKGDHEYEPIGQPEEQKTSKHDAAPPSPDVQMSAQEFQLHLEDRFFNQAPPSKPEVVVTAPSFDETAKPGTSTEPEKRKKSFMASAQEQGRIFQRKLSSQADNLKTKLSNMKKPKAESDTVGEQKEEVVSTTTTTETITESHTIPKKRFQKPDFTKIKGHLPEFKRPEMPKLKKPNFDKIKAMKRPSFDRPRMPEIPKMDFNKHLQSMKKLGRSKSVKEEEGEQKPETSEQVVPESQEGETVSSDTVPTKKKRFEVDFRTYPRMITAKFKKTKKTAQITSARTLTPVLKPRTKGSHSKQELDTESGQFTEYNKDIDLDRETSVERRMRVHLEKAIEEYRQIEEEETKHQKSQQQPKEESLPRKKKGKKAIPQPESFDSREFDFNQNEMDSEGASKASTQELQDIIKRSQIRPFGRTDTQSLQSGDRRGVLEEIDDDQFFLRKKGISEDNIQMGEYISSAIREGLMDPVNVLAQMGQYDDYQLDEEEMRYLEEIQKQGSDFQLELDSHLMPNKPGRRHKKQSSEEVSDEHVNKWTPIKDIDEDSVEISHRDFSRFVPPTPPKRRKKRNAPLPKSVKNMNGYEELPDVPMYQTYQKEVMVYRQEQTFAIPLAKAESGDSFVPIPSTRRSRSRSQSALKDENRPINIIEEDKLSLEVPGYAVIKKDPPPRPPAPQPRRSKSTRSHERPFKTMPHLKTDEPKPERPARNYSTIIPDRPPRKNVTEVEKPSSRGTPYEEVSDSNNDEVVKKLQSGEVLSKMKDRPLPAPPRPPREKVRKSGEPFKGSDPSQDDDENQDDNDDKGGSAVRATLETADSFTDNEYKIEEVDVSCQTDPLPDDFQLEELEITDDMRTITPTMYRESSHLNEIHGESHVSERFSRPETPSIEQELQRIREGRPSSRHSINASSRTPSRPTTPALVYVERKITTPLLNNEEQIEASLTAHQVEIDFDEETGNVIVTGLISERPASHREERKEEDILKSLEEHIIPTVVKEEPKPETRKKEEPEIKVIHEHKVEQVQNDPKPIEEPIIEAVRAPIRPEPIVRPPEPVPEVVLEQQVPIITQQVDPTPVTPIIPQPQLQQPLQQLSPDQPLHLSNLSVDRLSVNELQASKISVSELDSSTINSHEIQCQSGNLSMRSIEIPPGVIEEIVERVNRVQKEQADRQSPISIPPPSFYQLSSEPQQQTPAAPTEEPVAPPRRARHAPPTDDQPSEPPTILSLTGQLANACGSELSRHGSNLMNYLRSISKDENRRDMHFVLFVLIIIIAGLFMIGMDHSDRTVHHHHWDFFNPPKNGEEK